MRRELTERTGMFVQALFADLLLSRAENVAVFFADLIGSAQTYNRPGTVGPDNWALRVEDDYERRYRHDAAEHRALNLPWACSLALKSPLAGPTPTSLVHELDAGARRSAGVSGRARRG